MNTWIVRVLWVSLPVTAGDVLADWMRPVVRRDAPRRDGAALDPVGGRAQRAARPAPGGDDARAARHAARGRGRRARRAVRATRATASWLLALVVTVGACALAVRGDFARVCAQGAAYGDEERFPLKVPPALAFVVVPVAIARRRRRRRGRADAARATAVDRRRGGSSRSAGRWRSSLGRLVHQLSRRWVVLVPAGHRASPIRSRSPTRCCSCVSG